MKSQKRQLHNCKILVQLKKKLQQKNHLCPKTECVQGILKQFARM